MGQGPSLTVKSSTTNRLQLFYTNLATENPTEGQQVFVPRQAAPLTDGVHSISGSYEVLQREVLERRPVQSVVVSGGRSVATQYMQCDDGEH